MKIKGVLRGVVTITYIYLGLTTFAFAQKRPLTLTEAEHLAINQSPELQRLNASSQALRQQSIADGQLPDLQLAAGTINVPTDTFSFTQDEMTMVQVGIQQQFARGRSLKMKSQQTRALAKTELIKITEQKLTLIRTVREIWLELHYWSQALHTLKTNESLYKELLQVTESQYSTGKINQTDVVQVQLELSKLKNQIIQNKQQIAILKAQLGRWIGMNNVNRPLALSMPRWPALPSMAKLQDRLLKHPLLQADAANIKASSFEVAYAKEQYKPGWQLGVGYGLRQGRMPDGTPRSDMLTAQVTMDLPFFTANRQDRQLNASLNKLNATQMDRHIHYRDLLQSLNVQYTTWKHLLEREHLYNQQLIPDSKQNAKAALLAYQNATTELTTVLRAYSSELTIQLEHIQLQVERLKAHATLLYLEGTPT